MRELTHESLIVYQRAIEFVTWSTELTQGRKIPGIILDKLKRAFTSIPLNIAEGAGKHTGRDQAKFYDIARGSALECAACLDVMVAMDLIQPNEIGKGKQLISETVAMLTSLSKRVAPDRTREERSSYSLDVA